MNECDENIPEDILTGSCLCDEAIAWEKEQGQQKPLSLINPRWEHSDEKEKNDNPESATEGDAVILSCEVAGLSNGSTVVSGMHTQEE